MVETIELSALTPLERVRAMTKAVFLLSVRRRLARLMGRGGWPPFNGQRLRTETVRLLCAELGADGVVETGTNVGSSTLWFANLGVHVFTVELYPSYFFAARIRLRRSTGVTLILGESTEMFSLLSSHQQGPRCPLVYLDAHWGPRLPLAEELARVWRLWDTAIVVIDDFQVPGDSGFGYDVYPDGAIALDSLRFPSDVRAYFPSHHSTSESGLRRGTCYLSRGAGAHRALERACAAQLLKAA